MTGTLRLRSILTPAALARLVVGWLAFGALQLARPAWDGALPTPALFALLTAIVAAIVFCAFGVVAQAERLAARLGDPYGTLVLTLSIVVIEVVLISAVMLGPGEHATIARDSVMAVSMIILNLVIGAALLVGGLRNGPLKPNRAGVSSYLSLLIVLLAVALLLPGLIGDGSYSAGQAVPIGLLTLLLYGFFLFRQMGPQKTDFQETAGEQRAHGPERIAAGATRPGVLRILSEHRVEVSARTALLVLTAVPIVLLSHDMAALLDDGLRRVGAPTALSGILIAMVVFLPETITTLRATSAGEIQRVSNLAHGALVSTVGLTIPAVLAVGLVTGRTVLLAESPVNLALLAVTLLLTVASFLGKRTTALHGGAHLMAFALYAIAVFS